MKHLLLSLTTLILIAFTSTAVAQQVTAPSGLVAIGDEVRFAVTPVDKPVGAESALALASIAATAKSVAVGKAKAGIYPLRFFSGSTVLIEGYLILVPYDSGKLTMRWEPDKSASQTPEFKATLIKYVKNLSTARMKTLSGPAIKQFAGENPVQVSSTFIVCVTPGLTSVCVVSLTKAGKDCAVEMLQLAADDMVKDKLLTKSEADQVKAAIIGTNLLVNITLSGKDFLTDLKDPDKRKKIAASCEALSGLAGAATETIDNTDLKIALKSFTDLIERTCLLIKKASP